MFVARITQTWWFCLLFGCGAWCCLVDCFVVWIVTLVYVGGLFHVELVWVFWWLVLEVVCCLVGLTWGVWLMLFVFKIGWLGIWFVVFVFGWVLLFGMGWLVCVRVASMC